MQIKVVKNDSGTQVRVQFRIKLLSIYVVLIRGEKDFYGGTTKTVTREFRKQTRGQKDPRGT